MSGMELKTGDSTTKSKAESTNTQNWFSLVVLEAYRIPGDIEQRAKQRLDKTLLSGILTWRIAHLAQ